MEEKKQPEQQTHPIPEFVNSPEFLRVGDLQLASSKFGVNELCGLALELLGNELVKEYLKAVEIKKQMGSYVD